MPPTAVEPEAQTPQAENKAQRVYRTIRDRVVSGEYSPGYRLVLSRLAQEFDVSPVPVREAVRRLEAQGLVDHTRNVGFEVTGVDPARYSEAMETLAILEGAATALSAPHLDTETLARARAVNERMRGIEGALEPVRFTELNLDFHTLLSSACPNAHLLEMLAAEWINLRRVRRSSFTYVPDRSSASVREHDEIIALVENGAPADEIERLVRVHTLRTRDGVIARRG